MQNIDNITNIITYKFKENMWCDKELVGKRKLRYWSSLIQKIKNYLSILKIENKKINIAKIRTKSHKVHSETGHWRTPKTPSDERICYLCDTKQKMKNTSYWISLPIPILDPNLKISPTLWTFLVVLSRQNYGDLRKLLSMFFIIEIQFQ